MISGHTPGKKDKGGKTILSLAVTLGWQEAGNRSYYVGDREQEWISSKLLMRGDAGWNLDRDDSGGAHQQKAGVCKGELKSRQVTRIRGVNGEADPYVTQGRKQIRFTIVISSNHSLEIILVFLWHIFYYSCFKEEIGTQRSANWSSFSTEMLGFKPICICFQSLGTKLGSKHQRELCHTPDWIKVCLSHNFYILPLRVSDSMA